MPTCFRLRLRVLGSVDPHHGDAPLGGLALGCLILIGFNGLITGPCGSHWWFRWAIIDIPLKTDKININNYLIYVKKQIKLPFYTSSQGRVGEICMTQTFTLYISINLMYGTLHW